MNADTDPARYAIHHFDGRGFSQSYVHEGLGGLPIVLVHGWPETKRIWWRVITPLVDAGFEVIVVDLRGFGDSDVGPGGPAAGFGDVPTHARDIHALIEHLGHTRVVLAAGDLGGPVIQDLSARFTPLVDRLVLFNSPLPFLRDAMTGMRTRPAAEASDYFIRQGTDADALSGELATPEQRIRYISTFYTSRFWGHPGSFDTDAVSFHARPFADADHLRAGFRAYESSFSAAARSEAPMLGVNATPTLILFGPSDHVMYPDFDLMAAHVFPNHVGPFLLRNCGHFVPWEAAHAFTSATTAFCGDLLSGVGKLSPEEDTDRHS